jgi:hypothetical protein
MLKRPVPSGLTVAALLFALNAVAEAAIANPSLGATADERSTVTPVRWVCGPRRCAWIPNYAGRVVVRPYMRHWAPPPRPHCNYVRGPRGRWALVCP